MNAGYLGSDWQAMGSVAAGQTFTLIKLPVTSKCGARLQSEPMKLLYYTSQSPASRSANLKTDNNVLYCTFLHISLYAKQTIMHYHDTAKLFLKMDFF